jgi:hypothetical protein
MLVAMTRIRRAAAPLRRIGFAVLIAIGVVGPGAMARAAATPTPDAVAAMHWFTEMQAGRTDRSQYAPAFGAEVTKAAVAIMSRDLNRYGAAPLRAEIVESRKEDGETFYTIKFVFPRGDATTLVFGFDAAGRISGVAPVGMAGD